MAPKASGDERNEIERTDAIDRLRAGEPVSATWISLADPAVAEITATLGFDIAFFDTEHTPADLETVANLLRGLESMGETELILRVPSGDPAYLKRVLDIGLSGVMVPMIETAAQAEDFVEATTYPPDGQRGTGVARAQSYGASLNEYVASADESVLRIPQIESRTAVENADDIAAVDGIETLFLGPLDLSKSLGVMGEYENETFLEAVETVVDAAHSADIPVGVIASGEDQLEHFDELGFDWQIVGIDLTYIREGAQEALSAYERIVG